MARLKIINSIILTFICFFAITILAGDKVGTGTDGSGRIRVVTNAFPYPEKIIQSIDLLLSFVESEKSFWPPKFYTAYHEQLSYYRSHHPLAVRATDTPIIDLSDANFDNRRNTIRAKSAFSYGKPKSPIIFYIGSDQNLDIASLTRDFGHEVLHNALASKDEKDHKFIYDFTNAMADIMFRPQEADYLGEKGDAYEFLRCKLILRYKEYSKNRMVDRVSCGIYYDMFNPEIDLALQ